MHPPVKSGNPLPGGPLPIQLTKGNQLNIAKPEQEQLDMETAIALRLIPADMGK